jgi:hypothetical protein
MALSFFLPFFLSMQERAYRIKKYLRMVIAL